MELTILTRGQKNCVDQMITELQGKYLPYMAKGKDANGNDITQQLMLQLAVRPLQLWQLAFPKECFDVIANTLWGTDKTKGFAYPHSKVHKMIAKGMQTTLGLTNIPEWKTDQGWMPLSKQYVSIMGIGLKEDKEEKYGEGI